MLLHGAQLAAVQDFAEGQERRKIVHDLAGQIAPEGRAAPDKGDAARAEAPDDPAEAARATTLPVWCAADEAAEMVDDAQDDGVYRVRHLAEVGGVQGVLGLEARRGLEEDARRRRQAALLLRREVEVDGNQLCVVLDVVVAGEALDPELVADDARRRPLPVEFFVGLFAVKDNGGRVAPVLADNGDFVVPPCLDGLVDLDLEIWV